MEQMSPAISTALPPAARTSATASASGCGLRPVTTTFAPALAMMRVMPRPMPLPPPVTTTHLPLRENMLASLLEFLDSGE